MRRWRALGPIAAAALLVAAAEKPTDTGDPVGIAAMDRAGRITLRLRSVQCDGMIAEGFYVVAPTDPTYRETLAWTGPLRAGQEKQVLARDVAPCPKRR